jgi:hypothetical protein
MKLKDIIGTVFVNVAITLIILVITGVIPTTISYYYIEVAYTVNNPDFLPSVIVVMITLIAGIFIVLDIKKIALKK